MEYRSLSKSTYGNDRPASAAPPPAPCLKLGAGGAGHGPSEGNTSELLSAAKENGRRREPPLIHPQDGLELGAKASGRGPRPWLAVLAFGLAVLGFAGCRTYSDSRFSAIETPDLRAMAYATNIIQEGDVVSITFQYTTNFNSVQKVALDGTLSLDKLGQVKAAGSTVGQLHDELARLYKPFSKQDTLTVKLAGALTSVYVTGAVVRPGRVAMERPMTALEAIMEAGGFDPVRAKITQVVVLRLESGVQRTHRINIKRAMRGEDGKPFYLQPFDIVFVPAKTFNF